MSRQWTTTCVLGLAALALAASPAAAEVVRYRYRPMDLCGHTALKVEPGGAAGEYRAWALGVRRDSYYCQPQATHMVTFRHPHTCQDVKVPIAFQEGTPRIAYESDAVVYSYGFYTIRVEFLRDGGVDVIYNSGLFRPLR